MSEEEKISTSKPDKEKIPLIEDGHNPRNIPKVIFIEDIETFVDRWEAPKILEQQNELYRKFKYMESQLAMGKANLKVKTPEIKKSIKIIELLKEKHEKEEEEEKQVTADFMIAEQMWAKAKVPNTSGKVGVWLGANVMVEYNHEEALELLAKNLEKAETKLVSTEEDLLFIKDQITTMEVNMARVYNTNVHKEEAKKQ